jgi:hypothetical protein
MMTIEYFIDENDFLTYHMYAASKSERIQKKRYRNKILVPVVYVLLGLFSYYRSKNIEAIVFIMVAILWFFLYPLWEKRRYVKHYKDYFNENTKEGGDSRASMELDNDFIITKEQGIESKVATTEIVEIIEINTSLFIKLTTGQSFILPKNKIKNIDVLVLKLKELATYLKVKYTIDDKWAWK